MEKHNSPRSKCGTGVSILLALSFLVSFLGASCASPQPTATPAPKATATAAPTAAATPAPAVTQTPAAKSTMKLRIVFPQKDSLPTGGLYNLAVSKGFFADEGLEIEPLWTSGGGEQVQLIVSGDGDIALQTGFAAVVGAWQKGAPITIIAANETGQFLSYFYAKGDSPIQDFTQLSGKRIGYSNPGSGTHMAVLGLQNYYKSKGWALPVIVAAGDQPSNLAAVLTGQLDVGWAGYPTNMDQVEQGKIKVVFDAGRDLPGLDEEVLRVMFANNNLVKNNPEAIRRFLRVWKKVSDYGYTHTSEAFASYSSFVNAPPVSQFVIGQMPNYIKDKSWRQAPLGNLDQAMQDAILGKFISAPLSQDDLKKLINLDFVAK